MSNIAILRVGLVLLAGLVVLWDAHRRRREPRRALAETVLGALVVGHLCFTVFLWVNHLRFPLNLDLMEGVVLQHFQRAAEFQSIYTRPSPEYVPLAYNPLYYVVAVPFGWVLGNSIVTLRVVAVLGMAGCLVLSYVVVRSLTGSWRYGAVAAGLFAAAYGVMDTYLDNAHSDSWLLFTAFLGSLLVGSCRSRFRCLAGVAVLSASFWFKQHGALFLLGGLTFLTWRDGPRRSWPCWALALALGPLAYVLAGPWLFGPFFHYFTWEVPRAWSELDMGTLARWVRFTIVAYPVLAIAAIGFSLRAVVWDRSRLDVWRWQLFFALLTGLMGALDPGSANNVFIPMGAWLIVVGTAGLHHYLGQSSGGVRTLGLRFALLATFALFAYNPLRAVVSASSFENYRDLVGFLRGLDGPVYAPSLGQLPDGYTLYPAAHWVALDDMTRGPGRDNRNDPRIRDLLDPVLNPSGNAYVLANYPLEVYPWLAFLNEAYVPVLDLGDRFKPLRVLPKRFDHGWPRYLYRYDPAAAARRAATETTAGLRR